MQWVLMKGTGRLVAFTCISIGPPWMVAKAMTAIIRIVRRSSSSTKDHALSLGLMVSTRPVRRRFKSECGLSHG